jgi:hypothetical protein
LTLLFPPLLSGIEKRDMTKKKERTMEKSKYRRK